MTIYQEYVYKAFGSNHQHVFDHLVSLNVHQILHDMQMTHLQIMHLSSEISSPLFIFQTQNAQILMGMLFIFTCFDVLILQMLELMENLILKLLDLL